ncbi:MAG: hypothetical protein D6771_03870 [Zetaproteobacteria bacterium]|nr:MAG: hypothetical protein D6771_03870 [Zetaproteobacteria bacterium]
MRWLALAVLLVGCALNPATHEHEFVLMSERDELELGKRAAAEVAKQMRLLPEDAPIVRYVRAVGRRIAEVSDRPRLVYRFFVVDDPTVNAFALPGGWIYVNRGLVVHMNDEAELAAVIGHEVGHVTARDAVRRYTQVQSYQLGAFVAAVFVPGAAEVIQTGITDLLALAIIQGYGRKAEMRADRLAVRYLKRAGYDPYAAVRVMRTLERLERIDEKEKREAGEKIQRYHGVFASHPETEKRIEALVKAAAEAARKAPGERRRMALLRAVEGLPYAESEAEGAVVAGRFIHPKLGIHLVFPSDWAIENAPEAVRARKRKEKAFALLRTEPLLVKKTPLELLKELAEREKFTVLVEDEVQDGFRHAALHFPDARMPKMRRAAADVHAFVREDQVYYLYLWCPRDEYLRYQSAFRAIAQSFGRYDPKRDGVIPYIRLIRWPEGETWSSFADKLGRPLGPFTAARLAALNGMDESETPAVGTWVKIVAFKPGDALPITTNKGGSDGRIQRIPGAARADGGSVGAGAAEL